MAVETASTFEPLHEYGTAVDWARYSGGSAYAGRGYIQLTHDYNYRSAGAALGVDLAGDPDLAMDSEIAARVFAWYWTSHGIPALAEAKDWLRVRQSVVGRVTNPPGLPRLITVALDLLTH